MQRLEMVVEVWDKRVGSGGEAGGASVAQDFGPRRSGNHHVFV